MVDNALGRKINCFPLRKLRENAHLSMKALAAISGISVSTISRLETQRYNRPSLSLVKLCDVFGIYHEQLSRLNMAAFTESECIKRVDDFLVRHHLDGPVIDIVKDSRTHFKTPAYIINKLIEASFFKDFKKVAEVRRHIYTKYHLEVPPSVISNILRNKPTIMISRSRRGPHQLYKSK